MLPGGGATRTAGRPRWRPVPPPGVRRVVVHRVVLGRAVVPEGDVARLPPEPHLVLRHMGLLREIAQQAVALLAVHAGDPGGERGVDEEQSPSGLRVGAHHRMLHGRKGVLERYEPLGRVEAGEPGDEVVHGGGPVDAVLHLLRQIVVGGGHVGPHGVPAQRRNLVQLKHGTERGPLPEGHIGVPDVLEGGGGSTALVEADDILTGTLGEQRVGLQLPHCRAKSRCCADVRRWPRKNSTFHSSSARFTSSLSASPNGRARLSPRISAPIVRPWGTTSKCSYGRSSQPSGRRRRTRAPSYIPPSGTRASRSVGCGPALMTVMASNSSYVDFTR